MDSIDRLWDRIENWLAANAPASARAVKPGVTDEESVHKENSRV